ncbi:hypothetical protein [Fodinibius sediminis]|uniref:Outer membrane receptor proteins, mostly Fe transport n=1 Tax=Fodinibius sediminis TaxID=1214077 RepID=A0A521APC8_9BACT|nr:hypothetical protein [Fodinibius sediminis]SMO36647.1 hypothetical protein SAMN06265218_101258 [Fodinibius sediminis]
MIRRLFILLLFLCCNTPDVLGQATTEKKDSLATSILIKPNDILQAIPEWTAATTDGFAYRVHSGRYGFYGPQPTVYIDDIPIDFSYFNWQNLNMLPLSTDQIKVIGYHSDPRAHHGMLARSGYLDLRTLPPDTGFSIYSSITVGNQIEDPGPWSYDPSRVTPNIDRRGPHYISEIAYGGSRWYAKGHLSLRQHQPTNLNNNHRIGSYSYVDGVWHPVKTTVGNGLAEVGFHTGNWSFRTRGLLSTNDEYVFFQPFGREIPAVTGYRQLAVKASRKTGSWSLSARYLANHKSMEYRVNNKGYNFDWWRINHLFSLSSGYQNRWLSLESGGILEISNARGLQMVNQQSLATLYGSISSQLHRDHSLRAGLNIDIATHETATSLSIGSTHQLTDDWSISAVLDYNEMLNYRQESSTYWYRRGYDLFSQLGITHSRPFSSQKNSSTQVKLTNDYTLAPAVSLTLEGTYIDHHTLNIPWQVVAHDEEQYTGIYTHPRDFAFTAEHGSRFRLKLGLTQKVGPGFTHELNMIHRYNRDGTARYHSYWKQIPKQQLRYAVKIRPVTDLSFSAAAFYRSTANWKEYQNLEGEQYRSLQPQYPLQYGTFHTRTPSFFNIDITARKWFWDRRLATTFSLRNLLNTEVRYHTLGPDQAMQFIIKASLSL